MLYDDLVIAARQRAREPELPEATIAHALAGSLPREFAKYDLIVLAGDGQDPAASMIATEFARHGHRVFWARAAATAPLPAPLPPALIDIPWESEQFSSDAALTNALLMLRREYEIESAVLLRVGDHFSGAATALRALVGWRSLMLSTSAAEKLGSVWVSASDQSSEVTRVSLDAEPSWPARWAALDRATRAAFPRLSVIIITFDNLAYNKMCLASIIANTDYPNLELVLVDNGSTDGTVEFLKATASRYPHILTIFNPDNRGFGPANNQGIEAATGELIVLLNNDTMVARGAFTRIANHLEDESLGLIGPGTNRTCNEAQLDFDYNTYGEFLNVAKIQATRHDGQRFPIRMLAMFCTGFRKSLADKVGPLDERYAVGMFEDEDFAIRVRNLGYEIAWTPEVYVHHAYHASIGKLLPTGDYLRVFRTNQQEFEYKWGICWERHRPAPVPPANRGSGD